MIIGIEARSSSKHSRSHCSKKSRCSEPEKSCLSSYSQCELELEHILERPTGCPVAYWERQSEAAQASMRQWTNNHPNATFAEELVQMLQECENIGNNFNGNVVITNGEGTPLCMTGNFPTDSSNPWQSLGLLFIYLDADTIPTRAYVYETVWVWVYGTAAPAGTFSVDNLNDLLGLQTIMVYFKNNIVDYVTFISYLQTVYDLAYQNSTGYYNDAISRIQVDITFLYAQTPMLWQMPTDSLPGNIYTPVLSRYGVTYVASTSGTTADQNAVDSINYLYQLYLSVFTQYPYSTVDSARYGAYSNILRFILNPAGLVYSFANVEPITLRQDGICQHGFTFASAAGARYRVVLTEAPPDRPSEPGK